MASRHALLHPNSIYQSNRDGVYANACVCTGCFFHASQFPLPTVFVCVCAHMCVCAGVNVCVQSLLQWGEIRCPQYARAPESQTITQIQISKKTKQKSCNMNLNVQLNSKKTNAAGRFLGPRLKASLVQTAGLFA